MALVFCRECGKQISDTAASCPGCGAPQAMPAAPAQQNSGYTPVVPSKEFNPPGFLIGAFVSSFGAFLTYGGWVGSNHPYNRPSAGGLLLVGLLIMTFGFYWLLTRTMRAPGKLSYCTTCQQQVIVRPEGFFTRWSCERCKTVVRA